MTRLASSPLLVSSLAIGGGVSKAQACLACLTVGSLFLPTRDYPLLCSVGEAQFRIQDVLFVVFLLAVAFGPAETRRLLAGAARTWTGLIAALFVVLAALSLAQVPGSDLGESIVALGKLVEFSLAAAVAGVVIVATRSFLVLVATLGIGTAVNAAISLTRALELEKLQGLVDLRPDGLLGVDILAAGGAVTAVAGLGLLAMPHRYAGAAVAVSGLAAMLVGKSLLAAVAFAFGVIVLFALVQEPPAAVAIALPLALMIAVVGAREADVVPVTRLWDRETTSIPGTEWDGNLLENDGFESSTEAWNATGSGVELSNDPEHRFGEASAKVTTPGRAAGEGIVSNRFPISPATTYSATSWVKASTRGILAFRAEWSDADGRLISRSDTRTIRVPEVWQRISLRNQSAPPSAATAKATIHTAGRRQALTFLVDDVTFAQAGYANGSLAHRLLVFYIGARVAVDHPLTGVGWFRGSGSEFMALPIYERDARKRFPNIDPSLYPSALPTHSHSAYVQTAADAGVPALAAFVAVIVTAFAQAVRSVRRLRGYGRLYAGIAGAIIATVAFWLNSSPLFGGALEVGLLWLAIGMSVAFASDGPKTTRVSESS